MNIATLFENLGEVVEGASTMLLKIFNSIVSIFWTTTGETQGPTFIGVLVLLGVGVPLVFWGFNFIIKLFNKMSKKGGK